MKLAFFDIDHTLINTMSTRKLIQFLFKKGKINILFTLKALYWILLERLHKLDAKKIFEKGALALKGKPVDLLEKLIEACFEKDLKPLIYNDAVKLINKKRKTHKIVLVTAQFDSLAELFREYFKADYLICTKLEKLNNFFTGRISGPVCYEEGKVKKIKRFLELTKIKTNLTKCEAYSDGVSDIPMLKMVGNPIAVNPDPGLTKHAKAKAWEILYMK